jgi:hypothetical protein
MGSRAVVLVVAAGVGLAASDAAAERRAEVVVPAWCATGPVRSSFPMSLMFRHERDPAALQQAVEIECRAAALVHARCGHHASLRGVRFEGMMRPDGKVTVDLVWPTSGTKTSADGSRRTVCPLTLAVSVRFSPGAAPTLRGEALAVARCPELAPPPAPRRARPLVPAWFVVHDA